MQPTPTRRHLVWPLVIIVGVVVVDQITKIWAVDYLSTRQSVEVLGDFFRLTLVYNTGGAMGTRIGPSVYYLAMALIVLPVLLYYVYRNRGIRMIAWPLSFIAGGAIGNLIDRIRLGKVVDFLDFDFFNIDLLGFTMDRYWAFNIADSAITCSIVFLVFVMLFVYREPHGAETPTTESSDTDLPVNEDKNTVD
ncbi:signal peptidase II [candidate division GN15 bacterium]|nr:signal peptidase II [candidate division GN15 bacterium]